MKTLSSLFKSETRLAVAGLIGIVLSAGCSFAPRYQTAGRGHPRRVQGNGPSRGGHN